MLDVFAAQLGIAVDSVSAMAAFFACFLITFGWCYLVGAVVEPRDETDATETTLLFTRKILSQALGFLSALFDGRYLKALGNTLSAGLRSVYLTPVVILALQILVLPLLWCLGVFDGDNKIFFYTIPCCPARLQEARYIVQDFLVYLE